MSKSKKHFRLLIRKQLLFTYQTLEIHCLFTNVRHLDSWLTTLVFFKNFLMSSVNFLTILYGKEDTTKISQDNNNYNNIQIGFIKKIA